MPTLAQMTADWFRFWPDREDVTLRHRTAVGAYTAYTLTHAGGAVRRRALTYREAAPSLGVYTASDRKFLVPEAVLPAGVDPRPGDVIRDAAAVDWTIGDVSVGRFGQTHHCACRALALTAGLTETATQRRPAAGKDAAGRPALSSYATVATVACRVQPEGSDAARAFGRTTIVRHYTAYLASELGVQAHDQLVVAGVTYTILGYSNPARLWDLPSLSLELVG